MSWLITPSFATVWTPALISASLWLDADDANTITQSAGAISQWNDKSGNSRNATQSVASNRPLLTANGLNNKAVLTFDGINDGLSVPTATNFVGGTSWSHFAVARANVISTNNNTEANANIIGDAGSYYAMHFRSNSTVGYQVYGYPGSYTFAQQPYSPGAWGIFESSAFSGRMRARIDGGVETATPAGSITGAGGVLNIGQYWMTPGPFLNGNIAELILFRTAVSGEIREKIEGYLAHKWGLTANLPSSHPYKVNLPAP